MRVLPVISRAMPAVFLAALLALGGHAGAARAQTQAGTEVPDYPTRPVKIIVPTPPGGPVDVMARLTANYLQTALGRGLRHRKSCRRRQYHRLEGCGRGDAGRLYAALFERERARHRAAAAS